jgi:hypothetical protein
MHKLCLAALFGIGLTFATTDARAMPVPPLSSAAVSDVINVAEGCGRGFFRNSRGRCVPMRGMRERGPRIVIPTTRSRGERCRIVIDGRGRREVCVRR